MKIALINTYYKPNLVGGAELFVENFAKALVSNGHQVKVFCLAERSYTKNIDSIEVYYIKYQNIYWPLGRNKANKIQKVIWHGINLYNPFISFALLKHLEAFQPTIIHLQNIKGFSSSICNEINKAFPETPVLQTLHDYWHACFRNTLLTSKGNICDSRHVFCKLRSKFIFHQCNAVKKFISPSQFLKDYYIDQGLISADKIHIINNAIMPDAGVFNVKNKEFVPKKRNDKIKILYLGQLEKHKGILTLLEAIRRFEHTEDVEFIIAGKGNLEDEIKNEKKINFLGFITGAEKLSLLSDSDILIIPSEWYENYPLVTLEACSYGLAIIGSKIGGIPEVVNDGWNGKLFEPGNVNQLNDILRFVVKNSEILTQWKNNSLSLSENFSFDKMVAQYIDVYESIL